ncbi:serpin-ZX [Artemisia annua]|uniref:Serpin-ZX n=1 Tax=Artemisia annua TaxID=35608 RepID=A0A2U1PQG8_ARTAN|nr:serpin-ZX [Artemisia annua]
MDLRMGPFSIEVVLGMLALGAEGKTSEQLLEFIGHKSMEELRSMSLVSRLLEQILLDTGKGGPDVRIANGVWVDEEVKPFQSACFQEVLKTVNKTKAGYIDIQNKPTELAEIINSWVKEKTNGLIPTFVDEFSLDEWREGSIPFMTSYKEFDYCSFEDYKMIKLPYESYGKSKEFSMHKLNELWIPKFKIPCPFEPSNVMEELGLTLPFKSFIKIDQRGTEAAAASTVRFCVFRSACPPPPENFVAVHPFMLMIRENTSRVESAILMVLIRDMSHLDILSVFFNVVA